MISHSIIKLQYERNGLLNSYIHKAAKRAKTSRLIKTLASRRFGFPLGLPKSYNIGLSNFPHLRSLSTRGFKPSTHRGPSYNSCVLYPRLAPKVVASKPCQSTYRSPCVFSPAPKISSQASNVLKYEFCRPAVLSAPQNHTRSQDNRMFKFQRLDRLLQLAFHLQVGHHGRGVRGTRRDQYVGLDSRGLGGLCE